MTTKNLLQAGEPVRAPLQLRLRPAHRILVAEDDEIIRQLNAELLTHSGFQVDAAEDGAAAWETIQRARYDLLVTDNDMPKVSGIELLHKLRAAHIDLPVIVATGKLPEEDFTKSLWLQPVSLLLKPYSFDQLLGTVRQVLRVTVPILILQLCLTGAANAQEPIQAPTGLRLVASGGAPRPDAAALSGAGNSLIYVQNVTPAPQQPLRAPAGEDQPIAMTTAVVGKCEYSENGVTFTILDKGHILQQGATIRTGDAARTDLFFRRTGTTVRLQAGSELRIEKMTLTMKDGLPVVNTLLDLRKGRIFTVVRSSVAGSTLEIRNADGRSIVEGSGIGRYIITADGSQVAAAGSAIPLRLVRENGITILSAGQQFTKADGKMLPVSPPLWVKDMIELDELQAITEQPAAQTPPKP